MALTRAMVRFGTVLRGQGLPVTLSQAVNEFQISANMAFSMYGGLTMGATAALLVHGTPEQKQTYVPKMVAGEWTGTMNLTEPQAGFCGHWLPGSVTPRLTLRPATSWLYQPQQRQQVGRGLSAAYASG